MTPHLDIRTTLVLLLLSAVLMAVVLSLGPRNQRPEGLGKWVAGLGLVALGWLLIALRGVAPPLITVALADAALLGGLCLQIAALMEFAQRKPPRALALPPALLFLLLLPLLEDFAAYTLLASAALAPPLLVLGAQAWRLGRGGSRWPMALFYLLGSGLLLLRAADIWLGTDDRDEIFDAAVLDSVTFVTHFAMTITGSFGFLEMRRQRAEAAIRHLAMFDGLTDLLNHRAFVELAQRELELARRSRAPFAVLMIDIDRFKGVNDTYGHIAGDRVLAAVAAAARAALRVGDLLGRYGGEEFAAVIPGATSADALAAAERVRAAVERLRIAGIPTPVTVSVGAAVCTEPETETIDAVIGRADEALYAAKDRGRNRVELGAARVPEHDLP